MTSDPSSLLSVAHLKIGFENASAVVDDLSFLVGHAQTLALVGESGSGKTLTGLSLTGLLPANARIFSGELRFENETFVMSQSKSLKSLRATSIAYIFQEPFASLNPVISIGKQVLESVEFFHTKLHPVQQPGISKTIFKNEVLKHLSEVGLEDVKTLYHKYPHQLSGGMLQRVAIAMALACRPKLLIADEASTALDVTIQAQIITLLRKLKIEKRMSMIFITHNLALLPGFADKVLVLRNGRLVEQGDVSAVLKNPTEPYTQSLIACLPIPGQGRIRLKTIAS
jgi:ABC-type dipeptide/oligopeptide/nickel transport system ATPase component